MTPLAKSLGRTKITLTGGFVGDITTDYDTLVEKFGKPGPGDDYKVTVEWVLEFSGGIIVTIYDWKIGVHYLGPKEGIPPKTNKYWHIGGNRLWADTLVRAVVEESTVRKVKMRLLKDIIKGIKYR